MGKVAGIICIVEKSIVFMCQEIFLWVHTLYKWKNIAEKNSEKKIIENCFLIQLLVSPFAIQDC